MKIVEEKISHGKKTIAYQMLDNGTCYHQETDETVVRVLERARANGSRVRIFYGDAKTGKCWNDENDVTGTIGRSTGTIQIPLLIPNRRSMGGGGILDHCIVRIFLGHVEHYRHPKYKEPKVEIKQRVYFELYLDGNIHAGMLKTADQAQRLADFMTGKRLCK